MRGNMQKSPLSDHGTRAPYASAAHAKRAVKRFERWRRSKRARAGEQPPRHILVNATTARTVEKTKGRGR
jgi:hypothetical protein